MRSYVLIFAAVMFLAPPASATLVTVNFDSLPAVTNNFQPGNSLASAGVNFTTLLSIPNPVAVGDTLSPTVLSNTFWLISNFDSVSPPNFAAATNGGFFDLLMTFDGVVNSISLQTDDSGGENVDIVRLLGLQLVGPNSFLVVALAAGPDDATTAPGNVLSFSAPITHAIFQTTTEQEGFDNLVFDLTAVPEPSTLAILGLGLAALATPLRGRGRR